MTSEEMITCPYCGGAVPADLTICPSCQEDLAALIKLRNTHVIQYNEALMLARSGELDQAQARAELAVEARPEFAPAHLLLAKLHARQGRWAQAQASLERAQELLPDDPTLDEMAQAIAAGAYDDAARARAVAAEAQAKAAREQAAAARTQPEDVIEEQAPAPSQPTPQRSASTARAVAEQQLDIYERDVTRAFGLGAAAMGGLALLWRLFFGRRQD